MFRLNSVSTRFSAQVSKSARAMATTKGLKEGERVPNVVFKARVRDEKIGGPNPFKWKDVSTSDLFANKRVVLFALPGGL